ncbi:phage holin family protein [Collimonas sp.]|jgi:hypothetical protein|uniref:phage holin family protein n=1 Tax=Collimonas sp. TaxID=1963772 RepID=UPI002BBC4532|nr:phage holin family protein [Collimonas sp.]HWX01552.1 phage holin family protein [Collimonas sp.]
MDNQFMTLIALLSYAATCLRLLAYRRGLANYKLSVSLFAWMLIVFSGTRALEILFAFGHAGITFSQAGIAAALFLFVYRANGNVAEIMRRWL